MIFRTPAGPFAVRTHDQDDGVVAAFVSADPRVRELPSSVLDRLLSVLGLRRENLSNDHPPRLADAGNEHPIVVLEEKDRFDTVTFDPLALRSLMVEQRWVETVTIPHCSGPERIEARNLFPVGTMNEDPATGSAAAAVGGYLRELDLVRPPAQVTIRQGHHLGLPCALTVSIPATGGITVSGSARDCAPSLLVTT